MGDRREAREDPSVIDLLLLGPALAVIGTAAVVVRRERRPVAPAPVEADPVVDLTFLRATPREVDLRITQLKADATGSLGARMQLAQDAQRPAPVARRRRTRPLVAAR